MPNSAQPSIAQPLRFDAAASGHFDELRGTVSAGHTKGGLSSHWAQFFASLPSGGAAELQQRAHSLERQIRDNGVTYNVYSDSGGPQRPWSLDLFPLIIRPADWATISKGVLQRVQLLDRVMADIYGSQQLLAKGLLPPALVHGHPGYLRAMHGVPPIGGTYLHIAAFDLARGPDGNWWLVSQRTQAPSGLGYLLENRLAVSRLFPQAFEDMRIQRVAGAYRALMASLRAVSPGGADAHIALLTPGPYNETYFEHAYLARYLGLTLVEGGDMLVRDQRLYLKTLKGLVPIHALLKRLDDQFLDPLELRADSTLGVPGLLQAVRAGNLLVANAPGSDFLESAALLGFLPAVARHLLGQELILPALPTWWCGERSAMEEVLPRLAECAIKATYPGAGQHGGFEAALGRDLSPREIDEWAGRIARHGDDHTIQAYLPLAQLPTWNNDPQAGAEVLPRSVLLRVFAVSNGKQSWQVLPGGLARVAMANAGIAAMQRGGSSADVWVMTDGEVDRTSLLAPALTPGTIARHKRLVTSRAAENLFWLGRYTERAENSIALARLTLECLAGENPSSVSLLTWLGRMAVTNNLVLPGVPPPQQSRRVFERSLVAALGSGDMAIGVGYNLQSVRDAASAVRERLSQPHWSLIVRLHEQLRKACAEQRADGELLGMEALNILNNAAEHLAAITGAQTDRMTRDDGWRLLSIGRHIERLGFLSGALAQGLDADTLSHEVGFEAMVALFDSTITFRAQFQQSREIAALIDLLVLDRDNPRSLAWVAQTLRGRLAKLAGSGPGELGALSLRVPDPSDWTLADLCAVADTTRSGAGRLANLRDLLARYSAATFDLSEVVGATYFSHSGESKHSVGA